MPLPTPPSAITINGDDESPNLVTKAMGHVTIRGTVNDPDGGRCRMVVRWKRDEGKDIGKVHEKRSDPVASGDRAVVELKNLDNDTRYTAKCFTVDNEGKFSADYNGLSWWMNRKATTTIVTPGENAQHDVDLDLVFDWSYTDPDGGTFDQDNWELRWRVAATPERLASDWHTESGGGSASVHTVNSGTFKESRVYEWQVRGQDTDGQWAHWSTIRTFTTLGESREPRLMEPVKGEAIVVGEDNVFRWKFRDPSKNDSQVKADLRYRPTGTVLWTTLLGDAVTPGIFGSWTLVADTLLAGFEYEWQARTYDFKSGGATPSPWSDSETFRTIPTPNPLPILDVEADDPSLLGVGTHTVHLFDRGGEVYRGKIGPLSLVRWERRRDDISGANINVSGFGIDQGALLETMRCWMHEVVIYRDDERVFEGPITRLTYKRDSIEIEAKDVMAYVYRRIMRQGYNDSWRIEKARNHDGDLVEKDQLGLTRVPVRGGKIIQNALAYDDPNVLVWLSVLNRKGDAQQSRIVNDYAKTSWEEIDDLAANAGLDYTTLGRRIMLWDTHNAIGILPEMSDDNFDEALVVSEYGMLAANHFGVTDGTGVFGVAKPVGTYWHNDPVEDKVDQFAYYGPLEMLASSYGSAGGGVPRGTRVEQRAARQRRVDSYAAQAKRNIAYRWPTPLVVRLPDNSSITPDTPVGINHLVPGVWVPLRAENTLRKVTGWQKLDRVVVEETAAAGETVRVTMSPAPNGGLDDPDVVADGEEA